MKIFIPKDWMSIEEEENMMAENNMNVISLTAIK